MKIPLTVLNLLHQKARTGIAILGLSFATMLIFMQLGFYNSAAATATVFLEKLDFDLVLLSLDYLEINHPAGFPRSLMMQANSFVGVREVTPLFIAANFWRIVDMEGNVPGALHGRRRGIMVVGFNPDDRPFVLPELEDQMKLIKVPLQVLIDTETRTYFRQRDVGLVTDLGARQVRIAGEFTIGSGYGSDGMVLVSDHTFSLVFGGIPMNQVSLGLVKLAPGADRHAIARALQDHYRGRGVRVLTRQAIEDRERGFWLDKTAVGKIFSLGVLVALVVGTVFVYQVISSDITQRFAEYATLKAMGYGKRYLAGVVLQQAILYGLLGYLPGFAVSLILYSWGSAMTSLPITMTWPRAAFVLVLTLAMCTVSGVLAIKKVHSADPADLF